MDADAMIVDAQVHIWGADTPGRPWPADAHTPHRAVPLGADELLRDMNAAGVDRAILVPPSWEGVRNDLVLAAASSHPDRFAAMGRVDIDAAGARETLANWREHAGLLGFRLAFALPKTWPLLTEGRADWVWAEAERAGAPLMVYPTLGLVHLIDSVAERHPGLRLVIDHFALPLGAKDEQAFDGFDRLLHLAMRPNVAVKASALPFYTTDSYPYRRVHDYVRRAYDAFGPRRLFWGSDISRLPCTYRQSLTMFTEDMPWLGADDKAWIMGRGICEWLGWQSGG
jgi:L-fuconolactonase